MIDFSRAQDLGSPEPISLPKIIGGKKYLLKEASEGTHAKIKSLAAKGAIVGQDGKVTVGTHVGEIEAFLVSECLWECNSDTGEPLRLVALATVKGWAPRIVHPLSEDAERISGMKKPDESPERKALIAALTHPGNAWFESATDDMDKLESFRRWAKELTETDPTVYEPLWLLVAPKEDFDPKK